MDTRRAGDTEIDQLAQLWYDGWQDAHAAILPAELKRLRTLDSFRERLRAALPHVTVIGPPGAAAGFVIVEGGELYQLFVAAPSRGSGIAGALITEAETQLRNAGVEVAWLACAIGNDRAARFYEKHGWQRTGIAVSQLDTPEGPFSLEVWRYEKRLTRQA